MGHLVEWFSLGRRTDERTDTMSPQLIAAYPQLGTMIAGSAPLAAALDAWAAGDCITKITPADLATDSKI